jgi:hypothetical protein
VILIVTNRSDHTADWLILELQRRRSEYVRFNTEDYPGDVRLAWTPSGGQLLKLRDREIDLGQVGAVWYRRPMPPAAGLWSSPQRARWAMGESREALRGVWRTLDALWVNHPDHNRLAGSKQHQLCRAQDLGFVVPASLVSNDRDDVRAFAAEHGLLICKPLGEGRLELEDEERTFFTSRLKLDADDPLDDFGPEPYLVQELIKKQYDLRVTVIGEHVFGVRIDSQAVPEGKIDWRQAGVRAPHAPEELPADLAERCLELVRAYGLEFAAIDLVRARDGRYVFLEINPNGQWAWLEQVTGLPLRARLVDLLERRVSS